MDDAAHVVRTAGRWLEHGEKVCIATVIKREGSGPREIGAKMAIASSGETAGSIGGGAVEKKVIERAQDVLKQGRPALVTFDLSGQVSDLDAMCGGIVTVFMEPLGQIRRLFVFGAGHVGKALSRLAGQVGFAITLIDDRDDYLADESLTGHVRTARATPADWQDKITIDETSFVVICTRGHSLDKQWLRELVAVKPRYLGMLGSKHKVGRILEELRKEGVSPQALAQVHAPVGLPIKALAPEEIAVSIVAELILEWRKA
jgi:xanthine dehydrogenase accessory factor